MTDIVEAYLRTRARMCDVVVEPYLPVLAAHLLLPVRSLGE